MGIMFRTAPARKRRASRTLKNVTEAAWRGVCRYVKTRSESPRSFLAPAEIVGIALATQATRRLSEHGITYSGVSAADDGAAGRTTSQGLKVLVIDDSKTIRRTAETLLAKEGCEVFTAVDGFDALTKIADHQPDIVFVDIMMPRLDGYQTCALIKHNKVFRSIPVIMLSSKDGLFDRARGRIVGSEHYLTKPFTKDELLGAIEAHIGR